MAQVIPRRRVASLLLVVVCLAASVLSPAASGADPVSDKRTEAEKVADKLESLRMDVEILAEQYNDARLAVSALNLKVAAASNRAEEAKLKVAAAKKEIAEFAISTYVHGDAGGDLELLTDERPDNGQRRKYASAAIGNKDQVVKQFRDAEAEAEAEITELSKARKDAEAAERRVGAKKKATEDAVVQHTGISRELDSELALLVEAEEERREAAAIRTRPEPAPTSDEPDTSGSPDNSDPVAPPVEPPAGGGAARAIAAGKTQLGVPYLWAGDDPSTGFDCSGFILWAWAQGGKTLPHSSRAMYAMSTKIPMSELQPGDLVFYGQPTLHHVALYMGGGQIIHSPSSGDVVKISDVYYWDELVGAGRV